jgi:succinate dehydrogenase / fumarate reductase, flavoprotein subunit
VPRDVASRAAKERCDAGYGVGDTGLSVFLDFKDSIKKQGKEAIEDKYGNLFEMYEKIAGTNPYEEPMRIYPAGHYTMGGLWVDYNMMTTVPGLFAIGEANFSVHGANRLGAASLMQCAGDGYFIIPYTIGDYLSDQIKVPKIKTDLPEFEKAESEIRDLTNKLLAIKGKQTPATFHKRLGKIMWDHCGMFRNQAGLKEGMKKLDELEKEFWTDLLVAGTADELNQELEKAGRMLAFFKVGKLMMLDALDRNESCGAHFREESQTETGEAKRDDANYTFVSAWEYKGEDKEPVLHKEALKFEYVELKERSYK